MQELYDEMIPGITEHQAAYAERLGERLGDVAEVVFTRPARDRDDVEVVLRELRAEDVAGIAIVMLTYGPSMRTVRGLIENPLPILLANVQPEPSITAAWDMADLTYNQGIHGAQDQANALLRTGVPFSVLSGDWSSEEFGAGFESWARAAQTVTELRSTKIAQLGYPMTGTGDILYDAPALLRVLGPTVVNESLGDLHQRMHDVTDAQIDDVIARHGDSFAVDPNLPRAAHAYAARMELAIRGLLEEKGYRAYSAHFESVGRDGRFEQLPLLAASDLMAEGFGYAAEGDMVTATLMCAGQTLIGDANFSEMYAMDFDLDSVLVSHMGEGNWKVARRDRPVRLIDRELGIGGLGNPPTTVFSAEPGPATTANLVPLEGEAFRLVVGKGEALDTPELPAVEMPHFHFRPQSGVRQFMDDWLRLGATHHFVVNLGDHAERWRLLAEQLDLDYHEI